MSTPIGRYLFFILLLTGVAQCKKRKAENPNPAPVMLKAGDLTVIPLDEADYHVLTPLGSLGPPFQVFPKDHGGFYVKHHGTPSNVKAPGKLHIYEISRDRHSIGTPGETQDYSISFGSNSTYRLALGHVATLSTKLLQAAEGFAGATCNQYSTGGSVLHEQCIKTVSLDVEAGEIIGTTGILPGQYGMDFLLTYGGKNWCVIDYFPEPQRTTLRSKTGDYDPGTGIVKPRTKEPVCGEIYQDIDGTLHGNWLLEGQPKFPMQPHIAFVKSYLDPDVLLLSVGNSLGTSAVGLWPVTVQSAGFKNRKFTDVTVNGSRYCYDVNSGAGSIIVKLETNRKITAEYRAGCNCNCSTGYDFGSNAKTFVRE